MIALFIYKRKCDQLKGHTLSYSSVRDATDGGI